MEYAPGGELKQYIREKGSISEIECQSIMNQICSAVHYCHQKGVIHRDLKLENVLISNLEFMKIKVVDFGISGYCKDNSSEKTDAGTLKYMPPELHSGEYINASQAMDVWAIGIMLYAMLFGHVPFTGQTQAEVKDAVCNNKLKFPKDKELSKECEEILTGMLEKDR